MYNIVYDFAISRMYDWTCFGSMTLRQRGVSDYRLLKVFGVWLRSVCTHHKPRVHRHEVMWIFRIENSLSDTMHRHAHFLISHLGFDSHERWQMIERYNRVVQNSSTQIHGTMRLSPSSPDSIAYVSQYSEFARRYYRARIYVCVPKNFGGTGELWSFSDQVTSARAFFGRVTEKKLKGLI